MNINDNSYKQKSIYLQADATLYLRFLSHRAVRGKAFETAPLFAGLRKLRKYSEHEASWRSLNICELYTRTRSCETSPEPYI